MVGAALLRTPGGLEVSAAWWSSLFIKTTLYNVYNCWPVVFPTRNKLWSLTRSDPVKQSDTRTVPKNVNNTATATKIENVCPRLSTNTPELLTRQPSNVSTNDHFN